MNPPIILLAAVAANGVIGTKKDGHLGMPWHLPEDLRYFKQFTLGHPIIMGRKTWESIGRALPQRRNIVVSRQADYAAPGAEVFTSLAQACTACAGAEKICVIGGAEIFAQALPMADQLELTEIKQDFDGETRFPAWSKEEWQEMRREALVSENGMLFDFVTYRRRSR